MSTVTKPIALDETLEGVKDAILSLPGGGHVTTVAENLADAYDSTASYAVGDLCIYENVLYKCNTAIASGGESWTAAHWTATTIASAINKVESDIASIHAKGSTNTTGAGIDSGTYFYLNGVLVRAIANIATSASFTQNTNYEVVTAGGLNRLKESIRINKTLAGPSSPLTLTFPSSYKGLITAVSASNNAKGLGIINVTTNGTVSVLTIGGSLTALTFNTGTAYQLTISDSNSTYANIALDSLADKIPSFL